MSLQSLFQCSANDSLALFRILTEVNVPHRITFRVTIPFTPGNAVPAFSTANLAQSTLQDKTQRNVRSCRESRCHGR